MDELSGEAETNPLCCEANVIFPRWSFKPRALGVLLLCALIPSAIYADEETIIRFTPGDWNTNEWTAIRLPNQEHPISFAQKPDSIGTTTNTFTKTDYSKERDNALLLCDTGTTEGEIEVTFRFGPGFQGHSTPGICLSPKVEDGVLRSGIAVFVSTSAVAVWYERAEGNRMRYAHLGQLARWTDPSRKHTLICRFSKVEKAIAIRLDDSDVLVFRFVGDPRLSYINHEIDSTVALWGCHGACDFYEIRVRAGQLPFHVREPAPPK